MDDGDTTQLNRNVDKAADSGAPAHLLSVVYDELRRLAAARMARESHGQTLQPTALVHEVWLRLGGEHQPQWANRAHFFAAAAECMRRILIDQARRKNALRHGGDLARMNVDATGFDLASPLEDDAELLLVNEAVESLASVDARKAQLVKLKFFVGLTTEEAAAVLGISTSTANRDWEYTRSWLFAEVKRLRG